MKGKGKKHSAKVQKRDRWGTSKKGESLGGSMFFWMFCRVLKLQEVNEREKVATTRRGHPIDSDKSQRGEAKKKKGLSRMITHAGGQRLNIATKRRREGIRNQSPLIGETEANRRNAEEPVKTASR